MVRLIKSAPSNKKAKFFRSRRGRALSMAGYMIRTGSHLPRSSRAVAKTSKAGPFSRQMFTRLIYSENTIAFTPSAGAVATSTYRANSLYDPRWAAGGGQPRFFDSLVGADNGTAPYNRYQVLGCKVSCGMSSTNSSGCTFCMGFREGTETAPATLDEARMRGYRCFKMTPLTGSRSQVTLKGYRRIRDALSWSKIQMAADMTQTSAVYNANPTAEVLVDLMCFPDVVGTYQANIGWIRLTYLTRLFDTNDVADS